MDAVRRDLVSRLDVRNIRQVQNLVIHGRRGIRLTLQDGIWTDQIPTEADLEYVMLGKGSLEEVRRSLGKLQTLIMTLFDLTTYDPGEGFDKEHALNLTDGTQEDFDLAQSWVVANRPFLSMEELDTAMRICASYT